MSWSLRSCAELTAACPADRRLAGGLRAAARIRVTAHDYYVRRAVEYALAAEETPSDRTVLLHLAATYFRIASDIETRQAERRCASAPRADKAPRSRPSPLPRTPCGAAPDLS